jgi:hypothetical protein
MTTLEVSFTLIYDAYSTGITYDDCHMTNVIMFIVQATGVSTDKTFLPSQLTKSQNKLDRLFMARPVP